MASVLANFSKSKLFLNVKYVNFKCKPWRIINNRTKLLCRHSDISQFSQTFTVNHATHYCVQYASKAHEPKVTDTIPKVSNGKKFMELENDAFHTYMENNPEYSQTIHKSNTISDEYSVSEEEFNSIVNIESWIQRSADDYFNSFVKVSKYSVLSLHSISDPIFTNLCAAFSSKCIHFNDEQLIKIFVCLQNWPYAANVRDTNFVKVWKALDAECVARKSKWKYKDTLYMIDLWYNLKLTRLSAYVMNSIPRLFVRGNRFSPQDLVQIMFYINTLRKVPKGASIFEIEYQLTKAITSLTIEEIAIVCAGFFKSQTRVSSYELINDIIAKLIEHKDHISAVNLATILKFVRYSQKDKNIDNTVKMLNAFSSGMKENTLQVNIHLACLCIPKRINNQEVFNNLIEQFLSTPANARLKDLGKIAELIVTFDITSDTALKACELILSELENESRLDEINKYPRILISILCNMSFMKLFNETLISKVLDPEFIKSTFNTNYLIENTILNLDQNVGLYLPDYKGNRLTNELVTYVSKRHSFWVPGTFDNTSQKGNPYDRFLRDFIKALRVICGDNDDLWYCGHFLPHFPSPDVLVHLDGDKNLVTIPNQIKKRNLFSGLISAPQVSGRLLVFVLCGNNFYTYDKHLVGYQKVKLKQLESIGYIPIPFSHAELTISEPIVEQADSIKKKIISI